MQARSLRIQIRTCHGDNFSARSQEKPLSKRLLAGPSRKLLSDGPNPPGLWSVLK
jgi:hypothetical protein